jgi:hypothetical protein
MTPEEWRAYKAAREARIRRLRDHVARIEAELAARRREKPAPSCFGKLDEAAERLRSPSDSSDALRRRLPARCSAAANEQLLLPPVRRPHEVDAAGLSVAGDLRAVRGPRRVETAREVAGARAHVAHLP